MTIRRRRSALYVPASNPRALAKARELTADVVIVDLEDAVAPEAKSSARDAVREWLRHAARAGSELVVRSNGLDTPWGADDLDMLDTCAAAGAPPSAILLPKISAAGALVSCLERLPRAPDLPVWAMIETPGAILSVAQIAAAAPGRLACLVVGTNDLAKDAGITLDAARTPLLAALTMTVLAARAHGLCVLDGVYNAIDDLAGFAQQCAQGKAFGFDGKTLIHPNQIAPCHAAFAPTAAEVEAARRIVAAFAAPENAGRGALRVDGRMVERLHLQQAQRTLALSD